MLEHIRFLKTAIRDSKVGAVAPTSRLSVRTVCRTIDCHRPCVVVEYGPGTGAFTRYLLQRLHPESLVLAIELNPTFARSLREFNDRRRGDGARLIVTEGDARDVGKYLNDLDQPKADYILSGIPFSFLDEESKKEIIRETQGALKPGGEFVVYQYSFHVRPFLRDAFGDVESSLACINLPPICLMRAKKGAQRKPSVSRKKFGWQTLGIAGFINARKR